MDETGSLMTNKFLFLILVLYSVGASSFGVEIGIASNPSSTSSSTFSEARRMSSQLSSSAQASEATEVLPWRDTNYSPLTGTELKYLVVQAALKEEETDDDDFLDVPGVAWMEHLNLIVGHGSEDRKVAEEFYIGVMGMTPDKGKSFHVNLGRQQFHLATPKRDDEIPHRIHGSVGLVVPDLDTLWERLQSARENESSVFEDTLFDFYKEEGGTAPVVHVRCPWGIVFRCYSASDRGSTALPPGEVEESPQKMTNLHAPHMGTHGADKMGVLSVGQPGIRFVEFLLPGGVQASDICDFYTNTLRCPASTERTNSGTNCCLVSVGAGIHLVYVEAAEENLLSKEDEAMVFRQMKGIHLCIYAHDFRALYQRLSDRSLIWTNPRFTHLDTCDTWEEAKQSRTLRFRHIVDANNKVLMEVEHETRPLRHGQFMKVPYYEPK